MAPAQLIKEHGRLRTGDSDFTVTDIRPDGLVIRKRAARTVLTGGVIQLAVLRARVTVR